MLKKLRMSSRRFWVDTPWTGAAHRRWFAFCAVCLSLYVAYVCYLAKSEFLVSKTRTLTAIFWFIALSVGVYALQLYLCRRLRDISPAVCSVSDSRAAATRFFIASLAISLAILLCVYVSAYPGGVNNDAVNQWKQAQSGEFNDWHPVFHTLLLWLCARVGDYAFAVFMQVIVFVFAMGYFACAVRRLGVPQLLVLAVQALTVGSSLVRNSLMTVGKDAAMCVGAVCLFAQCLNMLRTRGEWLKKPVNAVTFGLLLAFVSLVRHNGILLTIPMLACAFFSFRYKKSAALSAGVMLGFMLLVRGPLYGALDVVYPNNLVDESVGLPMTVLCNIKQSSPEKLDDETNAFLDTLADAEDWQYRYTKDIYNTIKFTFPRELIVERGIGDIVSMALRAAKADPRGAFEALNGITDLVWDVTGNNEGIRRIYFDNTLEEARYGWTKLNAIGDMAVLMIDAPYRIAPISWLFNNIGAWQLVFLLVTLWALYRGGTSRLICALPPLCYNLGTMMLLAGNDPRFFAYFIAVAPLLTLSLIYLPRESGGKAALSAEQSPKPLTNG